MTLQQQAGTATSPRVERRLTTPRRLGWQGVYGRAVVALDAVMIMAAAAISHVLRFGESPEQLRGVSYSVLAVVQVPLWLGVLGASRAYERRFIGVGSEEFRRVFDACVRFLAVVATTAYIFKLELARGYVGVALPLGTVLLLTGRVGARKVLHAQRRRGRACHRVIAVGDRGAVEQLAIEAARSSEAGLQVVAVCLVGDQTPLRVDGMEIPVLGTPREVMRAVRRVGADTIAVAGGWGAPEGSIRELAWEIEGTGLDLLVSPALTDVAGPRISIRPVPGLPLLHVEEPEFTGVRRIAKTVSDKALATVLLLVLWPVVVLAAIAIRLDSRGPVVFPQIRVGREGREFCLYKFRSMLAGSEAVQAELDNINEVDGLLFKIKQDPRITRVGRMLRRFSIDELPQLWNVLRGDMSLVGPRPPLPSEVAEYEDHVHRRLLVRPGMTGLWQVSGRSNLSWEESVRLDLHYVENWSVAMDFLILWKTLGAVIGGRGAY